MSKYNPTLKLAEFLKNKRIAANLTQMDVAKHLGYSSAQFISNWERGLSSPPAKVVRLISKLYKIPAEEIFEVIIQISLEETELNLRRQFKLVKG